MFFIILGLYSSPVVFSYPAPPYPGLLIPPFYFYAPPFYCFAKTDAIEGHSILFLNLSYFTQHDDPQLHPSVCGQHDFLLLYG